MKKLILKQFLAASALSLLLSTAHAVEIQLDRGEVTVATGALAALVGVGTELAGSVDYTSTLNAAQVTLGGFCFTDDASGLPPTSPTCGVRSAVPIFPTGAIGYDGTPAAPGSTFQQAGSTFNIDNGGVIKILAFSPTFNVNLPIDMIMLSNGTGTFSTDAGALGTVSGNVQWKPVIVPVPAAAWLFGSALLGLASLKRQRLTRRNHS